MSLLLAYGWQGIIFAVWVALCVGSFLNVVIYRLPVMLERTWRNQAREILEIENTETEPPFNLSVPRSRCPQCQHQIRWFENIPVISWAVLRAKCSQCGNHISARYPAIELLTTLLTLSVLATFGFTWLGLFATIFSWFLVSLTFIDYDTKLLPDQLTYPLLWLGLIVNFDNSIVPLGDAVIGAVAGYLFLWTTFWAFKLITGKDGMGYGDFKLLAALGAWMGWQSLPSIILVSACVGLLYAVIQMALQNSSRHDTIPFGPFLAAAGWVTLMFRDTVLGMFLLA